MRILSIEDVLEFPDRVYIINDISYIKKDKFGKEMLWVPIDIGNEKGLFRCTKENTSIIIKVLGESTRDWIDAGLQLVIQQIKIKGKAMGKIVINKIWNQEEIINRPSDTYPKKELSPPKNIELLKSPELIIDIHNEISKWHKKDAPMKLTEFIIWCTAYLKQADLHKSLAKKGNSSVGKDNMSTAISHLFPKEDFIKLTNATQSALEDDIEDYKILIFSEVNLGKDDKGANAKIIEVIKQVTEGGTSSMKKDVNTGYRTTKHSEQEQKTVIYGTTESADDDELSTRFIIGSVSADKDKITEVNINTCKWFAGEREQKEDTEWFPYAIKNMFTSFDVIIPFASELPNNFFDNEDPRSMRDCKRFLACVSAVAWVYQLQREKDSQNRIIAEPVDFLIAYMITQSFFNYTYKGLGDERIRKYIEAMNKYCDSQVCLGGSLTFNQNIFPRHKIQEQLGCSINTIKSLSKGCQDLSIIRFHHTENSVIYYERCQKGVKRVLIGYQLDNLISYFNSLKGVKISEKVLTLIEKLKKILVFEEIQYVSKEIDTP